MTSQLNVFLIHKLRGSLVCLAYILTCYQACLYNRTLEDVWSTGLGITCLYCTTCDIEQFSSRLFQTSLETLYRKLEGGGGGGGWGCGGNGGNGYNIVRQHEKTTPETESHRERKQTGSAKKRKKVC